MEETAIAPAADETVFVPLENADDPITDDLAPIIIKIGEVAHDLAFTVGSIRRLKRLGIDILRMSADRDRIMELLESERFDVLLSEGLSPRIEPKAISAWIESAQIHVLMKAFKDVQKAMERSTIDPNAPKVKVPNPKKPTGSTSTLPAE